MIVNTGSGRSFQTGLDMVQLARDPEALVKQATRANIRASVDHLRHGSEVLEQLIRTDGLMVVGAEYSIETGVVEFLAEEERRSDARFTE